MTSQGGAFERDMAADLEFLKEVLSKKASQPLQNLDVAVLVMLLEDVVGEILVLRNHVETLEEDSLPGGLWPEGTWGITTDQPKGSGHSEGAVEFRPENN